MKANRDRLHQLSATGTKTDHRFFSAAPEAYALRRYYWQLFATLTFGRPPRSRAHSLPKVFSWLRETAALSRIHFRRLVWVLRYEYGSCERNGHYHLLLAGLPPALLDQLCRALESKWWTIAHGLSEVTLYDHTRDGVGYILKLPPESRMCHPCNGGVFRSDGEDCEPMLSASLIEGMRRGRM